MSSFAPPLNLKAFIDEHRASLRPPSGHRGVFDDRDFMISIAGGPSQRKDFHVNPTEELFFQIEGDISVRIVDARGQFRDVPVREGELFLVPPGVPHSPQRPAGSIGLEIERRRPKGEDDQLRFYCDRCGSMVYEELFELADIRVQLNDIMDSFWSDATLRTCMQCGLVVQPPTGPVLPPPKDMAVPTDLLGSSPPRHARPGSAGAPGKPMPSARRVPRPVGAGAKASSNKSRDGGVALARKATARGR